MKLVRVRDVEVYPYGGNLGRSWDPSPAWDAFSRSSRRVSERFSELARDMGGQLPAGCLRMFFDGSSDDDTIHLRLGDGCSGGMCTAQVRLPAGAQRRSGDERARWALAVHHAATVAVAQRAGIDPEPFHEARRLMEAEGLSPRWAGPWKSSPSRRLKARLHQVIEDDGWARVRVEVASRDGATLGVGPGVVSPGNLVAFRRAVRGLRWQADETVMISTSDWSDFRVSHAVIAIAELVEPEPASAAPATGSIPGVIIDQAPEGQVEVSWGGINGDPSLVPREVRRVWSSFGPRLKALETWWSRSSYTHLSIDLEVWPHGRSSSAAEDGWLFVSVHRTPAALEGVSAEQLFKDVLTTAVAIASRRAKIEPPDLGELFPEQS